MTIEQHPSSGGATLDAIEIPRHLIDVAQVTCLLTIAMIEGQGTPYWFIEKLLPDWPQENVPHSPEAFRAWVQREQIFVKLEPELSPLSRYLLKTYRILDACWQHLESAPFDERQRRWLLDQVQDMVRRVYQTSTAADKEQNPLRIIGLLIRLLHTEGKVLSSMLKGRVDEATLHDLQEAMQGVAALYQAIGYATQEQRDVLTNELDLLVSSIAVVEQALRQGGEG